MTQLCTIAQPCSGRFAVARPSTLSHDALRLFEPAGGDATAKPCAGTQPILPGGPELREFRDAELVEVTEPELVRVGSKLLQRGSGSGTACVPAAVSHEAANTLASSQVAFSVLFRTNPCP